VKQPFSKKKVHLYNHKCSSCTCSAMHPALHNHVEKVTWKYRASVYKANVQRCQRPLQKAKTMMSDDFEV